MKRIITSYLFFLVVALCSFTQVLANNTCTKKSKYNILQVKDLVGWWGKCTKEKLLKDSNNTDKKFTFKVYFLQKTDKPKTVYFESALTKKTPIHLNPQNVMKIHNKEKQLAMSLLEKIKKYIPVHFDQVKSLKEANVVITIINLPQKKYKDTYGAIADNEDNIQKKTTKVYVMFNYASDPATFDHQDEFQLLFYHEIGHLLGLKEVWDDSPEMSCQYKKLHNHMPCYGDKHKASKLTHNPGPCTTIYTYVKGELSCPYPVFFKELDIAALQSIWGKRN